MVRLWCSCYLLVLILLPLFLSLPIFLLLVLTSAASSFPAQDVVVLRQLLVLHFFRLLVSLAAAVVALQDLWEEQGRDIIGAPYGFEGAVCI